MYFQRFLFILLFVLGSVISFAQKPEDYKQYRVLILLDGSSSMVEPWGEGKSRFSEAGNIILQLMDSIYQMNNQVEFGLRVYGHEHGVTEHNCYDTKREVMFSKDNLTQMSLRLDNLHPLGVSPIAYSLKTAAEEDFNDERNYSYSLILITDGGESCGGDICAVVKELLDRKIQFKPYIVSLVDYAPLKNQYACLGNYLLASKPSDVPKAVGTIAENYRQVMKIPVVKPREIPTTKIPTPSVLKIDVPAVTIKKEPEPQQPVKKEEPVTPKEVIKKDVIAALPAAKTVPVKQETLRHTTDVPKTTPPNVSKIVVDESDFEKEQIDALPVRKGKAYMPNYYVSIITLNKRKVPAIDPIKKEPEEVAAIKPQPVQPVAAPKPATTPVKKQPVVSDNTSNKTEAKFTAKKEPAAETTLEIFFTDGKGKFYQTTPPIQVLDAKTGKEVKKFFRTVDASGNPDPQKLPGGNYFLVIGREQNYVAKNVSITEGNKNKITIVATKGTLSFSYQSNPKRPVSEFTAVVKKNFDIAPIVNQRCNTEQDYEPGNYHIEINTLPVSRKNIDLDFGNSYIIDIDEPGYVQFTNENPMGKVSLYYQLGDQYIRFYILDITGNQQTQKLRLQPGPYEVHFKRSQPGAQDFVKSFVVRSNETTPVQLQ